MTVWFYGVVLALAGAAAVLLVVDLVRDRAAQDSHYIALAVLEVALLAQLVGGAVALARTERDVEGAVFVSYLVTVFLVPVVGALFSLAERSRVGTTILLLAVATVAGLELRLWDVWGGRHA
ncbi:hypothetical protein ACOACQ_20895 [Nocardioides sp. CPCC 206347]|uniref:hypothetical protein n=1 Tax=Nocardioides sp. CPCC 206347 TaxID=3406463 RepID=UPI003B42D687